MEFTFYKSPIELLGIALALSASFQFYKIYKHYSTILISAGFLILILTYFSINFCIGVSVSTDMLSDFPFLCSPVVAAIKGAGFLMIGIGLQVLYGHLQSEHIPAEKPE